MLNFPVRQGIKMNQMSSINIDVLLQKLYHVVL